MRDLLHLFEVAPVNRAVLESALTLGFGDFEDAVLHEAGRLAGARAIGGQRLLLLQAPGTSA